MALRTVAAQDRSESSRYRVYKQQKNSPFLSGGCLLESWSAFRLSTVDRDMVMD